MGIIREQAEKFWSGDLSVHQQHPMAATGESEEIAPGVVFFRWFANFVAARTGEGLVLIDTGAPQNSEATIGLLRNWSKDRINTVIYTHGHIDHSGGMPAFLAESQKNRVARPKVVGHRAIAARFERYQRTAGYNEAVNRRQFGAPVQWPEDYVYPDTYFDHQLNVAAGGEKFECHHGRGETDDHCWVYMPSRKLLASGDFVIWAAPNAGNPQKAGRYAREWAEALRQMARTGAEVLLPGHGVPVFGAMRVRQVLLDTAEYLQSLHDQTISMMNEGAALEEIVQGVKTPAHLSERPYLQAVYDEPEFIVRNVWRLEGGWYGGSPSDLKPATRSEQGREIAYLAGGIEPIVRRAIERLEAGELAVASHLIDWAAAAAPDDAAVHEARARIYRMRADQSQALITRGIFRAAEEESSKKAGGAKDSG